MTLVLVRHGRPRMVVVTELTGHAPDLDRWAALTMPDLIIVPT